LKRNDVVDDVSKSSEIQKSLVELEAERRRLQGV
jgi:hypothetical protein